MDFTHIGLITDDLLASTETIKQTIDSQMLSQEELVTVLAYFLTRWVTTTLSVIDFVGARIPPFGLHVGLSYNARTDHIISAALNPIKLAGSVLRFRYIRFTNTICLPSRKLRGDIVCVQKMRRNS